MEDRLIQPSISPTRSDIVSESNEDKPNEEKINVSKIKPVQVLVLSNDNVKRRRLPNGEPAPRPYPNPLHLDIVPIMLSMYTMWCVTSLVICSSLVSFMNHEDDESEWSKYFHFNCKGEMGTWTYILLILVTLSTILSIIIAIILLMDVRRRNFSRLSINRLLLGRVIVLTRTSNNKLLYFLTVNVDLITIVIMIVGWFEYNRVRQSCNVNYLCFYLLIVLY